MAIREPRDKFLSQVFTQLFEFLERCVVSVIMHPAFNCFHSAKVRVNTNKPNTAEMTRPFLVNRLRATFENEPGEGVGVTKGFLVGLCEALLTDQNLPMKPGKVLRSCFYEQSLVEKICDLTRLPSDLLLTSPARL